MNITEVNGIGQARAKKLLDKYGNTDGISRATPTEIAEIAGITENLAQEVLDLIGEPEPVVDDDDSFVRWRRRHYGRK